MYLYPINPCRLLLRRYHEHLANRAAQARERASTVLQGGLYNDWNRVGGGGLFFILYYNHKREPPKPYSGPYIALSSGEPKQSFMSCEAVFAVETRWVYVGFVLTVRFTSTGALF